MNWFERASAVIPGGVNSPVRAFKAVGGDPPFVASGSGARVTTTDGRELIDFIASWGAQLLDWLNTYTFPEETRYADPDGPVILSFLEPLPAASTPPHISEGI